MDHNHGQLRDIHSPRQQFELTQELGHLQDDQKNMQFQFDEGENPFSYYHEENKRQISSSEDQVVDNSNKQAESPSQDTNINHVNLKKQISANSEYPNIEVGDNISNKQAIKLQSSKSEKATTIQVKESLFSVPNIKLIKQVDVDLTKIKAEKQSKEVSSPLTQVKYKKQLEDDLKDLKNNIKSKDTKKKTNIFDKKDQKADKISLNKTYAPMPRMRNSQSQSQLQQMRMLIKMAFQKKKANYEMLKEWDRKRAESMALHGRMIELLQNEVDIRIKSSLQNFEYYQTFFRQKAKQQQKYVTSPVINTRYSLQNNSLSKNVYINCSVILNSLCDENTNRCKKINDFIQLIRINILRQLTENHLNNSQKQLLKIREKISTLKSSLKKYNAETEEKTIELANLFNQQSNNITNKLEKDFYRTQLSFLRKAIQQIQVQKKLGQYCLQYYYTAVQEQIKRSNVIRETMVTYSKGLKETYNLQPECSEMEQMSKNQELKLIQQFFSLQEMFDERTLELFKIKNHVKGDIDIISFSSYINKFNYEIFDSRIILLKEFNVRYITINKNKEIMQQNCYLVITVDNFLHFFFNTTKNVSLKPDITIKIANKWLQVKMMKDEYVDIIKKEQKRNSMISYFWDNKIEKVYRIKFNKKDNKEQFLDYITKLMVDNY